MFRDLYANVTIYKQPNDRPLRHKRSHRRPLNSSPPAMDYQMSQQQQSMPQGRYDQQAQQQHDTSYGASNHGNADDGSAPPAAYLSNQPISAMPQPPTLPSNNVATSVPQQQPNPLLSPIPAPEPFMMFFENNYLSQPHKHTGARTEDDLLKLAKKNWEDVDFMKQRRMYENQAQKQRQMYEDAQANLDYEMTSKQQGATRQVQGQGRVIQPKAEDGEARPGSSKGRTREEEGAAVHDVEMTGTPPGGGYGGFTSINR